MVVCRANLIVEGLSLITNRLAKLEVCDIIYLFLHGHSQELRPLSNLEIVTEFLDKFVLALSARAIAMAWIYRILEKSSSGPFG